MNNPFMIFGLSSRLDVSGQSQAFTHVASVHPGPILTDMGDAAGLTQIAEPPELVAESTISSLESNQFHADAGTTANQLGEVYSDFATNIIETDLSEDRQLEQTDSK